MNSKFIVPESTAVRTAQLAAMIEELTFSLNHQQLKQAAYESIRRCAQALRMLWPDRGDGLRTAARLAAYTKPIPAEAYKILEFISRSQSCYYKNIEANLHTQNNTLVKLLERENLIKSIKSGTHLIYSITVQGQALLNATRGNNGTS